MKKIITILFLLYLFPFFYGCKKNNTVSPPCICPPDFGFTDGEPAWSPDGKWIAYAHGDSSVAKTGIYLITPDGKENHIWHAGVGAGAPTWSPDGQWIAFNDGTQIWKKKLDGDSLIQLTFEGRNFFPVWSPDGQWIAYDNTDCGSAVIPLKEDVCGILVIDPITSEKKWLVKGRTPRWINNENLIYIGLNEDLYSFRLLDSSIEKIGFLSEKGLYGVSYLKYSPDAKKIAFSSQSSTDNKVQIWVMDADGSDLQQLTNTQGYTCDWSPDGSKIVYTDSRASNGRLWIMNADGSGKHQLTFPNDF